MTSPDAKEEQQPAAAERAIASRPTPRKRPSLAAGVASRTARKAAPRAGPEFPRATAVAPPGAVATRQTPSVAAPAGKPAKPPKLKKPKPVRDSFTMPKAEYELIDLLKRRAHARGIKVKKSELLRAGILALADMPDAKLFAAISSVPVIKTGRPPVKSAAANRKAGNSPPVRPTR